MDAAQSEILLAPLLKSVSRSFYLSMVFLPPAMRPAVSIAYLLARASDSVADNSLAPPDVRVELLRGMKLLIQESDLRVSEQVLLLDRISGPMADSQEYPSEKKLLKHYPDCLRLMRELPIHQQHIIVRVLETIHDGQIWDIEYFEKQDSVQSEQETLHYCYRVAGCVGEFWTRIGQATLPLYSHHPHLEDLIETGIRYGQGLQLVNILRDQREDAQRGRVYLYGDAGLWSQRARHYLMDGVAYSKQLAGIRLRFTAMLPALLGLATLDKMDAATKAGKSEERVKISRIAVYYNVLKAALFSIFA